MLSALIDGAIPARTDLTEGRRRERVRELGRMQRELMRIGDLLAAFVVFAGTAWLALDTSSFALLNLGFVVIWLALAWALVFSRFGIKSRDPVGAAVAVSGKAGLLLPAQLGRLVRPDLVVRLGRGTLGEGLVAVAVETVGGEEDEPAFNPLAILAPVSLRSTMVTS